MVWNAHGCHPFAHDLHHLTDTNKVLTAPDQIRKRDYPQGLASREGKILLVGITCRVRGRHHICEIEELDVEE